MKEFNVQMSSREIYDNLKEYNDELLDVAVNGTIDDINRAIENSNILTILDAVKNPLNNEDYNSNTKIKTNYETALRAYRMNEPLIFIGDVMSNYPIVKYTNEKDEIITQSPVKDVIDSYKQDLDRMALAMINSDRESDDSSASPQQKYYKNLEDFINTDITSLYDNYRNFKSQDFSPQTIILSKLRNLIESKQNLCLMFNLNLNLLDEKYSYYYSDSEVFRSSDNKVTSLNSRRDNWEKQICRINSAKTVLIKSMSDNNEGISDIHKYINFTPTLKIPFRNYLEGKGINRKTYDRFINGNTITNRLFYYELAFYLGLYNSDIIKQFFSTIGFSENKLIPLVSRDDYEFFEPEILRWMDCGLSANTINELLGFKYSKGRK